MKRHALTLVEVLVAIAIVGLLLALLLPAVQAARESSRRMKCATNLRQMALALHQYDDVHGVLPAYTYSNYSFHVALLPHLEQEPLYRQIDFGVNGMDYKGSLLSQRVSVLECPSDGSRVGGSDGIYRAATNYYGNLGSGAQRYGFNGLFAYGQHPLGSIRHLPFAAITDGLSQTAMLAEVAAGDGSQNLRRGTWNLWGSGPPDQFEDYADQCRLVPGTAETGWRYRGRPWLEVSNCIKLYNHVLTPNSPSCSGIPYWKHRITSSTSMHSAIVNVARADASVHGESQAIDLAVWRKLGSRNGNP